MRVVSSILLGFFLVTAALADGCDDKLKAVQCIRSHCKDFERQKDTFTCPIGSRLVAQSDSGVYARPDINMFLTCVNTKYIVSSVKGYILDTAQCITDSCSSTPFYDAAACDKNHICKEPNLDIKGYNFICDEGDGFVFEMLADNNWYNVGKAWCHAEPYTKDGVAYRHGDLYPFAPTYQENVAQKFRCSKNAGCEALMRAHERSVQCLTSCTQFARNQDSYACPAGSRMIGLDQSTGLYRTDIHFSITCGELEVGRIEQSPFKFDTIQCIKDSCEMADFYDSKDCAKDYTCKQAVWDGERGHFYCDDGFTYQMLADGKWQTYENGAAFCYGDASGSYLVTGEAPEIVPVKFRCTKPAPCSFPEAKLLSDCSHPSLPALKCAKPVVYGVDQNVDCEEHGYVLEWSSDAKGPFNVQHSPLSCYGETLVKTGEELTPMSPQPAFLRCRLNKGCDLDAYLPRNNLCEPMETCANPTLNDDSLLVCPPYLDLKVTFEYGADQRFVSVPPEKLHCLYDSITIWTRFQELRIPNSLQTINWIKCSNLTDLKKQHDAMQNGCQPEDQCIPTILQDLELTCAPGLALEARPTDPRGPWVALSGARCNAIRPVLGWWFAGNKSAAAPLVNCRAPRGCDSEVYFNGDACGAKRACAPLSSQLTCPPGTIMQITYGEDTSAASWLEPGEGGAICQGARVFLRRPPSGHAMDELPRFLRCNGPAGALDCTVSIEKLQKGCKPEDACKPPILRGSSIVCAAGLTMETRSGAGKPWKAVDSVICSNNVLQALLAYGEIVNDPQTLNCRARSCSPAAYFSGAACDGAVCSPLSASLDCPAGATVQVAYTVSASSPAAWYTVTTAGAYCRDQRLFLKAPPAGFTKADLPQYLRCLAKSAGKP